MRRRLINLLLLNGFLPSNYESGIYREHAIYYMYGAWVAVVEHPTYTQGGRWPRHSVLAHLARCMGIWP